MKKLDLSSYLESWLQSCGYILEADFERAARQKATVAFSPSQGTAWISRRTLRACRGPTLAHELGHILLGADRHSPDMANLMAHGCRTSNLANQVPNTHLERRQCKILWRRYAAEGD